MIKSTVRKTAAAFTFYLLVPLLAFGHVKLPRLVSDGMVLQRDTQVKVWGWASGNEKVRVSFMDSLYQTSADANGNWKITLSDLKAGGPYTMQIISGDTITISNILIGDVWLCSGQSNMELPMARVSPLYQEEIARSENPNIRYFDVPKTYDFISPHSDLTFGAWKPAHPENVLSFSAVAYFFGKGIYDKYKVPVGLVNASLGGSPAESWLSEDALKEFPKYYNEAQRFKDNLLIKQIENSDNVRIASWYHRLWQSDEGYKNSQELWSKPGLNDSGWAVMHIPGYWADGPLGEVNGAVWFRKKINVPASMTGKLAKLNLGRIVDADSVFVNGVFVGTTSYQYPPRRYSVPANLLVQGENTIVVRVISNEGKGGFVLDKPYELIAEGTAIDLKGDWYNRLGTEMESLAGQTFIQWKPLGLYNAMISPLLNYSIKGVLWYQGESNAERPVEYGKLLPALIRDWRKKWNRDDLPFLFVQLPNFMESKAQPSKSNWALTREAQLKTLSVPNTAMAVTIDIGEWNDIHPLDKKDVGTRLALAAQKAVYGDNNIVYSGPLYQSSVIKGNKIVLTFTCTGSGLTAKGGTLKQFAIAGSDKQFVWANAKIEKNTIVVWSEKVPKPVAVRYAWADNPEGANLYNKEGLPASPFRTDEWH